MKFLMYLWPEYTPIYRLFKKMMTFHTQQGRRDRLHRVFRCHWLLEAVALSIISHLAYSYKSVLFGNDLLADRAYEIFFDLCNTCCLRHELENVYYVLVL